MRPQQKDGLHKVLMVYHKGLSEPEIYQGVKDKLTKQALNDRIIMLKEDISVEEIHKNN